MTRVLTAGLIALAIAACERVRGLPGVQPKSTRAEAAPAAIMGPWILDPKPGQVTIAWVTDAPVEGRVEFGQRDLDQSAGERPRTTDHRVVLTGLSGSTRYRYRIAGDAWPGAWFTSPPDKDDEGPFRVLVYGDNRTNSGDHALVVRAAAAERPVLALHTGDMVFNARDEARWQTWFSEEADLLAFTPFVPTIGNHEITDDGVAYSRYFQRQGFSPYYALDYGPVHIVVLDSFEMAAGATPHVGALSDAQRAWFVEELKSVPRETHVWVLVHQGPFAHPARQRGAGHGGSEVVQKALAAGEAVHHLEAVFAGHEHFYERGQIDGLHYFVLGGGGAPLDDPDPGFPGVISARRALSYAVVEVCGCHARGSVKDIAGKVIDTFTLATCPKPCAGPEGAP